MKAVIDERGVCSACEAQPTGADGRSAYCPEHRAVSRTFPTDWTLEGYWNAVLGASRSPADVVREFDLTDDGPGLDEWLGTAEEAAWSAGGLEGDLREVWGPFHGDAMEQLRRAVQS